MEARTSECREAPLAVKWFLAVLMALAGLLPFLQLARSGLVYGLFLWPLALSAFEQALNPLLRLTGIYRYHSPMLKATFRFGNTYEIHGGTAIDYFIHLSWKDRGARARRRVLAFYLEGLLDIASRVEAGELDAGITIEGESYFFNDRTAERLGFARSPACWRHRLNLVLHFFDLTALHSFCRGTFAVPRLQEVQRASIPARRLLENRQIFEDIKNRLLR